MKTSEKEDVIMLVLATLGVLILVGAAIWVLREVRSAATPVPEPAMLKEYVPGS